MAYSASWLGLFLAAHWWRELMPTVNATYFGIGVFTVWAMRRTARHQAADASSARAWQLLALASACIIASGIAWTYLVVPQSQGTPVWNYVSDAAYAPLAIAAFLSFPRHEGAQLRRSEVALDGALLLVGTIALSWYFSFHRLLNQPHAVLNPFDLGSALVSWVVVLAACWGYLRASALRTRTAVALLMASQVLFIISELVLGPADAVYAPGDPVDVVFFSAWIFRWAAARWAWHGYDAPAPVAPRSPRYQSGIAPTGFVAGALAVLVYVVLTDDAKLSGNRTAIAVVASVMTWLLVARHATNLLTTRQQLRAAAAQKERFRAIMDSLNDYIFVVDAEGRLAWASASAVQAFATDARSSFAALLHPDDAPAVLDVMTRAVERTLDHPVTARLQRSDGTWVHVELRGRDLRGDPAVAGFVFNGRDRSAEIALEGRVRHAEKLARLHDMAGRIAHAFNNVLAVVQGHAELLAADPNVSAAWHDDVSDMRSAANRGAAITRQLLGFSGRQVIHTEALDVAAVVDDALPTWRRLLPAGTTVRLEGDVGTLRAVVDRAQLEQVLLNLVVNARDAMPAGGDIVIFLGRGAAADGSRRVLLSVRDSGTGMAAEQQAHIFEPFYTTKAPGLGTGLGLAMVDTIVRRSGGEITVRSSVGSGSTFTVALPAASVRTSAALPMPIEAGEPAPAPSDALVLLVDDEDAVRHVSARILTRAGLRVRACSGGAEALEVMASLRGAVDVLVTDMMMPGMSGRELIDRVVEAYPLLPVVVITGFAADVDTRRPMPPQVQRIIEKPFGAADLVGAVRRAASAGAGQGTRE